MSRKIILVAILSSILSLLFVATTHLQTYFTHTTPTTTALAVFDAKATLSTLNTKDSIDDFLQLEGMIKDVMKTYGTKAGFDLIEEGERQKIISSDACHGLLHYVGHAAYGENPGDYDKMLGVVEGTNCIGGYLHGIEAEIVLRSSDVVHDVQNFCVYQKEKHVNPGPCYHGVGHAATELYKYDVPKSLALCDALDGEMEHDLSNCYRGVFSEVGNIVTGYDGHTGLQIDTLKIAGLDTTKPFVWCSTFDKKYQSSCKSQLMKVIEQGYPSEKWIGLCQNKEFDTQTQEICMNIASGVFIRQQLSYNESAVLPKEINTYPQNLRTIAILGSLEGYMGYFFEHKLKEWKPFCAAFTHTTDIDYCTSVFTRAIEKNEAPWMDRSDIR